MIKAGIIGSTGYAGGELARLLLQRRIRRLSGMDPEAISTRNMHPSIQTCLSWWMTTAWMII